MKTTITENIPIAPVFADRLAAVQQVGVMTHLCFTAGRPDNYSQGGLEHVLEARIIVPTIELRAIAAAILAGQVSTGNPVPSDVVDAMVQ